MFVLNKVLGPELANKLLGLELPNKLDLFELLSNNEAAGFLFKFYSYFFFYLA
jgi:hypothetical protein